MEFKKVVQRFSSKSVREIGRYFSAGFSRMFKKNGNKVDDVLIQLGVQSAEKGCKSCKTELLKNE